MTKTEALELISKQKDEVQRSHNDKSISDNAFSITLSALQLAEEYVKKITSLQ